MFNKIPTSVGPYIDINDEMAPISSVPVPLTNEIPISTWTKEQCANEYRPTPPIDEELLSNARVIHGITSVPNRNGMKHIQQLSESYRNCLSKFDERSKQTSFVVDVVAEETVTVDESSKTAGSLVVAEVDNNINEEKKSEESANENSVTTTTTVDTISC